MRAAPFYPESHSQSQASNASEQQETYNKDRRSKNQHNKNITALDRQWATVKKQKKCVIFATNNKRINNTSKDKTNYNILLDEFKDEEHENHPESLKETKVKAKIIKELKHTARDINEMTIDAIDLEIQQFHDQFIDEASDNVDLESDVGLDSELADFDEESVQITKDDEIDDGYLHCDNSDDEAFNFLELQKNSNERYCTAEEFINNLK